MIKSFFKGCTNNINYIDVIKKRASKIKYNNLLSK